jgi:hypothetical protein
MFHKAMQMKTLLLNLLTDPTPLRVKLGRKLAKRLPLFTYQELLSRGIGDRPHYGHCIFEAAKLAARLDYPKISVIEFGCGSGKGLLSAEKHIVKVEKLFPVEIELYGFDTGEGLPAPKDYRDFPHYFKAGLYAMDRKALKRKLNIAKLVIGDVKDTCATFFSKHDAAPVGCIFHDLDYYSSTRDALELFEAPASNFLPRVFMYFDDIYGDNTWLVTEFAGELLAIDEFNIKHQSKKIVPNRHMSIVYNSTWWAHHMYNYHDFAHPRYDDFIAENEQLAHQENIAIW